MSQELFDSINDKIPGLAEAKGMHIWQMRRIIFTEDAPLCTEAREELMSLYPDEPATQLAKRYRTTVAQVHAAWQGREFVKTVDKDLALLMYNECQDINDAARLLGIARITLIRTLKLFGIDIKQREIYRCPNYKRDARNEAIVYDLEHTFLTQAQIGEKYDVSGSTVAHLNKNKRRYKAVDHTAIKADLDTGMFSISALARKYDVQRSVIYNNKRQMKNEETN